MTQFEIYDDQMTQDEYEIQMTISSLAPGRLMLTLFLAAQSRRAARTAIIIRASHPATEPVYGAGQSQTFYALVVTIINMLFGQVEEEAMYRAG